ncbi:lysyl oxidase homolog 3A-like [Anthonomus grandis grandis]|uniref:lysyl oxidase homolog 3A-like n=1 Tax=Anthonomus grandis grandis TaxID=2921223 RepID=UPI0021668062|nr:lysyl oxidase homolog 3A-like [Anthonomus grandis grandis]
MGFIVSKMPSVKHLDLILFLTCAVTTIASTTSVESLSKNKSILIRKHLKRLKKIDGGIRLVGGRDEYEGNVEILYQGTWGSVCDDEWDLQEASVVCKQLGYQSENAQPTSNSYFGKSKRKFWLDNIFCDGSEDELANCRFDSWGKHDCTDSEAAGVICLELTRKPVEPKKSYKTKIKSVVKKIRLQGGRVTSEGRVEFLNTRGGWDQICADGWSFREALVVCRTLSLGYAADAIQTTYFGGNLTDTSLAGVKCFSNETDFGECIYDESLTGRCEGKEVAAVACTHSLSDLVIDQEELIRSAYLQDLQMFYLQCAMEENCAASSAYQVQKENDAWHLETRRLLRFTARILNAGNADFRPLIPKHLWEWHMCHMHYHSMEVFATFDIFDSKGKKVAEGHKASFCLEDNQCLPGVEPKYACANYGDQGITVNCSDIYKHTVDCQWVDISDLDPGNYRIKVAVNPEYKVAEMGYDNNAAMCDFIYTTAHGSVRNCRLELP